MPRQALGRGLDALLPDVARIEAGQRIADIEVERIAGNPVQPRRAWDEGRLEELAASIREKGVLQPVIVRQSGDGFELVAGERRWRASVLAGLAKIPAVVVEMGDGEALEVALIENLQREDLSPLEEARAYRMLIADHGATQEAVAKRVGKSRAQVANMLRLLSLADPVQAMLEDGRLSVAHGKVLAGVEPVARQAVLAEACVERELPVRELERLIAEQDSGRRKASREPANRTSEFAGLEDVLRERLGTRVAISSRQGRGTLRIEFYDRESLERLVQLLVGDEEAVDVPRGTSDSYNS